MERSPYKKQEKPMKNWQIFNWTAEMNTGFVLFQCVYGEERTMLEFENYLIGLTNQEREQNDDDM